MAKKSSTPLSQPLGLVGRAFQILGGSNEVISTGLVRGQVSETHFLVQYEALNGSVSNMQIVDLAELSKANWRFYEGVREMKAAGS